jgi:hypothetical protein
MARPERDSAAWAKTLDELPSLSDEKLIEQHDWLASQQGTTVSIDSFRSLRTASRPASSQLRAV